MSGQTAWEKWRSDAMHPGGRELTLRLLEKAGLSPSARVADIGCGSGAGVGFLKERGFDAVGVDHSPALVEQALERHDVPVFRADARSLPFADASMDALLFECSLSVQEEPARVLKECARVLKSGGKLLVSDIYDRAAHFPRKEWESTLRAAGFGLLHWEDCSEVMPGFIARAIWELGDISQLKQACSKGDPMCEPGYFLMVAVKAGERKDTL